MRRKIQYQQERKLSTFFFLAVVLAGIIVVAMIFRLFLNFESLTWKEKIVILLCIPWLGIISWIALKIRKKEQSVESFYSLIRKKGVQVKGKVVKVRIDEIETESNDSTERSTLEYYALIEYYDTFHNMTVQNWTPELTGSPMVSETCQVFYDESGNFYVLFM